MKNHLRKCLTLSLVVLATTTSLSLAASNPTAQKPAQKQTQQVQKAAPKNQKHTQQNTQQVARTLEVAYYDADPMNGGKLLKTETMTLQKGQRQDTQNARPQSPFANAPQNARFVVVKDERGSRILDLSKLPDPAQPDKDGQHGPKGAPNGGPNGGRGPDGPQDGRGMQNRGELKGPQGGPRGFLNGGKVTFYDADPLNGGKVTATFEASAPKADVDAAAQKAKFAVLEHDGERIIIDLGQVPAQR